MASGTQLNYTWTCPNGPCNLGTGLGAFHNRQMYKDRMVINTMSPADSGRYSCRVAGDSGKILSRKSFNLTVISKPTTVATHNHVNFLTYHTLVLLQHISVIWSTIWNLLSCISLDDLFLFSNQRFIPDNAIITSMDTIGTPQGGAISCYSPLQSGSPAWSGPPGVNLTTLPHPESEGTVSLVVGKRNFTNGQYCCQGGGGSRCVHLYTSGVGVCVCVCAWCVCCVCVVCGVCVCVCGVCSIRSGIVSCCVKGPVVSALRWFCKPSVCIQVCIRS